MVFERSTPSIRVKSEPRFAFAYLSVFATTSCFPDFLRVELIAKVNYPLRWQKTPSGFGRTHRLIGLLVHQTKEEAAIIESRHVDTKRGRAVGKHRTVNLVLRQARPIHLIQITGSFRWISLIWRGKTTCSGRDPNPRQSASSQAPDESGRIITPAPFLHSLGHERTPQTPLQ